MKINNLIAAFALTVSPFAFGSERPLTLDARVEPLSYRSPGRTVQLSDGRFGAASKGKFLITNDDGQTWTPHADIPAGIGSQVDGGLLVANAKRDLVLVYRDDAGMKLERTADNMPLPGA